VTAAVRCRVCGNHIADTKTLFHILALTPLFWATPVRAASEALLSYTNSSFGFVSGTAGWTFQPQAGVTITSLGCFTNVVATQDPIRVGLWASDGSLLASASVTTTSALVNQSRYEPITALPLSLGATYYIGAFAPSGTIFGDFVSPQAGGSAITAPEIQLGLMASATNSLFEFPTNTEGLPGGGFMGPNFEFTSIPEPSALLLTFVGGVVIVAIPLRRWWRRLSP